MKMYGVNDQILIDAIIEDDEEDHEINHENDIVYGSSPLHIIINNRFYGPISILSPLGSSLTILSKEADFFRLLIHLYPAAINTRDSKGKNCYDLAVEKKLILIFYVVFYTLISRLILVNCTI
jgi:hypothetical protein